MEVSCLMFNMVIKKEYCPSEWKKNLAVPLFKEGDLEVPGIIGDHMEHLCKRDSMVDPHRSIRWLQKGEVVL